MPTDTKLKPLYRELTFWLLLLISLPGIFALYAGSYNAVGAGSFNQQDFTLAAFALPVVAYLVAGRQYARGKSVEAAGSHLHAVELATLSTTALADEDVLAYDEWDEDPDKPDLDAEHADAHAEAIREDGESS